MGLTITDFSPTCISNLACEDMLHGLTIRSHKSRGRLIHIRAPELPQGFQLMTASDLGKRNIIRVFDTEVPLFAAEETSYLGEPVALLLGPDPELLSALGEQIQVTFEELEPQFEREDRETRSVVLERELSFGSTSQDFASAEQTIEGVYRTGIQDHHYLEPIGALAELTDGGMTVHSPGTSIFIVRDAAAAAAGYSRERVSVAGCFPGDDLDGKLWYPAVVAAQAAAAAVFTGHSVRILQTHHEDSLYSPKRAPATVRISTAIGEEGNILSARAEIDVDMGSYPVGGEQLLERAMHQLCSRYRLSSIDVTGRILRTNTPPLGFFDGWGDAAASFALETHYNRTAEITLADPGTCRRAALAKPGEPLIAGGRIRAGSAPERALDAVIHASDFTRKHAAYELQRKRRADSAFQAEVMRGIGLATVFFPPLLIGDGERRRPARAGVRLENDGTATIMTSMYPGSSGAELAWRSTVCEVLGLPLAKTRVAAPRTDTCPNTGPESLSRGITVCTKILETCAQEINQRRFRDPLPIEVQSNFRLPRSSGSNSSGRSDPMHMTSSGAAVLEVEIEQHTMNIAVRGIWLAVDGGRILQVSSAVQRLEQGIYSALGFLSTEVLELRDGVLTPSHTIGYRIPRFGEFPDPHIQLIQPDRKGAALGIGELPGMCVPAAGIQAVSQASGVYFDQAPITPEIMYRYRYTATSAAEENESKKPEATADSSPAPDKPEAAE